MINEKATPLSHLEVISRRLVMRVRHRPGYMLMVVATVTLFISFIQYSDVLQPRISPSVRSESDALRECVPRSTASIWPWRTLQKQDQQQNQDDELLQNEPIGHDPSETYPSFREMKEAADPLHREFVAWHGDEYVPPPKPAYRQGHSPEERKKQKEEVAKEEEKSKQEGRKSNGISDPFPLLSQLDKNALRERGILPPQKNTQTRTPLLIGFTRNWPLLLQCVTSYMAAGWPARDIYVVENTGTMGSNRQGKLSLQNPFFLNHTQLVDTLGIHVIETPTLFTFAQLQNFYLYTAQQMNWPQYFWSHQDVVVFSEDSFAEGEGPSPWFGRGSYLGGPRSFHDRALATLKILTDKSSPSTSASHPAWATHFFDYDRLTLVNTQAYLAVGGWDTHISFYAGDCDMYLRLKWAGYWQGMLLPEIGRIFDVAGVLDDLAALFRVPGVPPTVGGWGRKKSTTKTKTKTTPEAKSEESGQSKPNSQPEIKNTKQQMKRSTNPETDSKPGSKPDSNTLHADLVYVVEQMHRAKNGGGEALADALEPYSSASANSLEVSSRNEWQTQQQGGQGEPFYRDPEGFEAGLQMHIAVGRQVYAEKWGHRGCDLDAIGLRTDDAWHVEHDWEEGTGSDGGGW